MLSPVPSLHAIGITDVVIVVIAHSPIQILYDLIMLIQRKDIHVPIWNFFQPHVGHDDGMGPDIGKLCGVLLKLQAINSWQVLLHVFRQLEVIATQHEGSTIPRHAIAICFNSLGKTKSAGVVLGDAQQEVGIRSKFLVFVPVHTGTYDSEHCSNIHV